MSLRRIPTAFRSFSSTRAALVKKPEEDPKTGAVPTVGSTYGGSSSSKGPLGGREGAMEDQWAYEHDKELIQKMLKRMQEMEKAMKEKGIDLPEQKK